MNPSTENETSGTDMVQQLTGKEIIIYARSIVPSLAKKERRVANFICNDYEELQNISINDLSKRLNVSIATVTKVSKKLKCSGYLDLKKKIADYLVSVSKLDQSNLLLAHELVEEFTTHDSNQDIINDVFTQSIVALQETLNTVTSEEIDLVAKKLVEQLRGQLSNQTSHHHTIYLFGIGGSGILCADFQHKLLKIGINAVFFNDVNMQLMAASLSKPGDIGIAISHSGSSQNPIKCLSMIAQHQGLTIAVTNRAMSPITSVAQYSLLSTSRNSPVVGENAAARLAQLTILDAIFSILTVRLEGSQNGLKKTRKAIR